MTKKEKEEIPDANKKALKDFIEKEIPSIPYLKHDGKPNKPPS